MNDINEYTALIELARLRGNDKNKIDYYTESHHIIPTCIGGPDTEENRVLLSAEEHYTAHKLLAKMHKGNSKLIHAWWTMSTTADSCGRKYRVSAEDYAASKLLHQNAMRDLWKNPEFKTKTSAAIKAALNDPTVHIKRCAAIRAGLNTKESKELRSRISTETHANPEVKERHIAGIINSWKNDEIRERRINGIKRKLNEPETKLRQKLAAKELNNRPGQKDKIRKSCQKSKRVSVIWFEPLKTEILNLWKILDKPGYVTFRKLAIEQGLPNVNYNALINKHFKLELGE